MKDLGYNLIWWLRHQFGVLALRIGLFRLGCKLLYIDLTPPTTEDIARAQQIAKEHDL